jgi:hypothetical protein
MNDKNKRDAMGTSSINMWILTTANPGTNRRNNDFEYDGTVLIKRVEYLNVDNEQVLTHSNCLIDQSNCLDGIGSFALNTELFYGLLN